LTTGIFPKWLSWNCLKSQHLKKTPPKVQVSKSVEMIAVVEKVCQRILL